MNLMIASEINTKEEVRTADILARIDFSYLCEVPKKFLIKAIRNLNMGKYNGELDEDRILIDILEHRYKLELVTN